MTYINVGLRFLTYIGKPYWPERNELINIGKDVNPRLGPAKKQAALQASLEKRGITAEQYEGLVARSENPFYTANGRGSEIVIPQRVIQSFINHASMVCPKAVPRIEEKGLTFIGVKVVDGFLRTGKSEKESKRFERFVKNEESNQRMFCSDFYIDDFCATGVFQMDEEIILAKNLQKLFEFGGRYVGMGTARPQGYGRFSVERWESD